jgi:branched-chain amino acid transport system ATP-binding protein
MTLLQTQNLSAFYGDFQALFDINVSVEEGETVAIIGANGAGKTTFLRSVAGALQTGPQMVLFDGKPIGDKTAHEIVHLGIAMVPEGRRLFPRLSVEENLLLGAFRPRARAEIKRNLDFCFEAFPRLAERRSQLARSMSGGEQQMLALARALMSAPRMLLVDEPSVGLAPLLVSRAIDKIKELKESYQLTVLLAEQNFTQALRIADRGYVIVHGKIAFEGRSADELENNDLIRKLYLGL